MKITLSLFLILITTWSLPLFSQPLTGIDDSTTVKERRAKWQIKTSSVSPSGRKVISVEPNSPLDEVGIIADDVILALNEEVITNDNIWWDWVFNIRANVQYQLTIKRGQQVFKKLVSLNAIPLESYEQLTTEYDWIFSDYALKQRTIITLPKNKNNKLPAIFILSGLSCSSIENTPGRKSNFVRALSHLIQHSNMLVMRVEKPGVGDSEGRCSETDFNTELSGYEIALQKLLADPRIDRNNVIVYGNSMGSALAPYFANKYKLKGIISDGTFYRSWFEHMLEIERRILSMKGDNQATINHKMNTAYIPLYYGMLIEKKSFTQLITENPLLTPFNYHDLEHMYGRPMSFYHQMQDFNFAGEWSKLTSPVRIRWGTNDWIMSEYDINMITDVLATAGNTDVKVYKYPGLDHWHTVHQSSLHSFHGKRGNWEEKIGEQLVDWATEISLQ